MIYDKLIKRLEKTLLIHSNLKLTLAEKILFSHSNEPLIKLPKRASTYLKLEPGMKIVLLSII